MRPRLARLFRGDFKEFFPGVSTTGRYLAFKAVALTTRFLVIFFDYSLTKKNPKLAIPATSASQPQLRAILADRVHHM